MIHGGLSLLILFASILSLLMCRYLLKAANGNLRLPSISNFFMYNYFVFCFIGATLLNLFYFEYQDSIGIYKRMDLVLNIWYYSVAGLFLIPLGMLIANILTGYRPKYFSTKLISKPIEISNADKSCKMGFIIATYFVVSVITMILFMMSLNNVPIISVLRGEIDGVILSQVRSEAGNDYQGGMGRLNYIFRTLPIVILCILFFTRNINFKWKIFFFAVLFLNIFISIMELHKAPVIQLVMLLALTFIYEKRKLNIKLIVYGGLITAGAILLMYAFFAGLGDRGIAAVLIAPFNRIFIGQIWPFYFWQLYLESHGLLWGATFSNPGGLLPFENIVITKEINSIVFPELAKLGIVGSMPTVFFADWLINFGRTAALFSMVFFGCLIQFIEIFFVNKLSKSKGLIFSGIYLFLIYYFSQFAGTTFTNLIFDIYLIVPLLASLSIYLFTRTKLTN